VVFWKEVLGEYFSHVAQKMSIRASELTKTFTLHNRRPAGLPKVIVNNFSLQLLQNELVKRKVFVKREQIISGEFYQKST
jgi:hypothetical protein